MSSDTQQKTDTVVSAGAGVAIAGVWLAAAAITIYVIYILFGTPVAQARDYSDIEADAFGVIMLIFIISLPMIAAYNMSKLILSKNI